MKSSASVLLLSLIALSCIGLTACSPSESSYNEEGYLEGVVTGTNGPEAGVWVIAETTELPTKFVKIVVTDDEGRYLLPELPDVTYDIWVRGYGLIDSPKTEATPGGTLNLTSVIAPNPHEAAEYYPAGYWLSLLEVPEKIEFSETDSNYNGFSSNLAGQADLLRNIKSGNCMACHQLGNKATRELPESLDSSQTTEEAWYRRIQSGQAGGSMISGIERLGR
ncbi:MAG: carboxypeptidase-like regulatory domain-containing protein, partial [Balneolales bacterium]